MMKKYVMLSSLLLMVNVLITAQEFARGFGNICQAEADYEVYPSDSSAEAVVFFDTGITDFVRDTEGGYNIRFIRQKRIKILSEAGLHWADFEIPFYQEGGIYEKVSEISGTTYNLENGQPVKTPLQKGDWHDEKINDRWNVRKIAMPNAKVGSIVEISYEVETPYLFNLPDWEFQGNIPTLYSSYEVHMIPFYEYIYLLQGAKKFDEHTSFVDHGHDRAFGGIIFNDMVYRFVMKDIPGFTDEEMITSASDYITKIDFQLAKISYPSGGSSQILSTWPKIVDDLDKHLDFGKYVRKSKKAAANLIHVEHIKTLPPTERFNAVMDYVKQNYDWNKINSKYALKSVKELVREKYGSSADLNLFAVGLLNACDIEAYPVWISTRSHGKIAANYPFTHFFNYAIITAQVDGKTLVSDATEVLLENNRIPLRCINEMGLVVQPKSDPVGWINLESSQPSKITTQLGLAVNTNKIDASVRIMATEYDGFLYRNKYGTDVEIVSGQIRNRGFNVSDSAITIKGFEDFKKSYQISYKASTHFDKIGSGNSTHSKAKIYVPPFLDQTLSENPLKQKSRTYPIDLTYPKMRNYVSYITIPEGYSVDYVPRNYSVKNSLFEMNYTAMQNDGKIIVTMNYYFKKSVFAAKDYEKIKFYFKQIVLKGNDKIVFSQI